jgi:peptidoglycan/LPS O-acetylase OafA/YrhL
MTNLQKHAWWSLVVGTVISLVTAVVAILEGVTTFLEDEQVVVPITGVFVIALVVHAITLRRALRSADERDREIFRRSPGAQVVAVFVTLFAWSVVLTRVYSDEGSVPIAFPTLMVWSAFVVSVIAQSGGVLMGYAGWAGAKS